MDEYYSEAKNSNSENNASVANDELMCKMWHGNALVNGASEKATSPINISNCVALIDNYDSTTQQSEQFVESIQNGTEFIFDTSDMDTGEWTLFTGDIGSEFHILDEDHVELTDITMETCKICSLQFILSRNEIEEDSSKVTDICPVCIGNVENCSDVDIPANKGNNEKLALDSSLKVKYIGKGEGRYYCNVCDKKFSLKKMLNEHSKTHLKEKLFQCHICMKQMNRKTRLREHLLRHEARPPSEKILICSICKMAFKDFREAQSHVSDLGECIDSFDKSTSEDSQNSSDTKLDKSNSSLGKQDEEIVDDLKETLLKDISDVAKRCVTIVKTDEVYQCEYCEKLYCEISSLVKHKTRHNGVEKPYKCPFCNECFSTYVKCTSHQVIHTMYRQGNKFLESSDINVNPQNKFPVTRLYVCEECNKTFTHRLYLKRHKNHIHNKDQPFNCEICKKEYSTKRNYTVHMKKVHSESNGIDAVSEERTLQIIPTEPSYHCTECGETYLHSSNLRNHKRRCHKKEKNFCCSICKKIFFGAHDLKKHFTLHSGERPFTCETCQRSFRTKSTYNEHVRTHSGEKPYSCDICGHAFNRARSMKSHRLTHMKKRQYNCSHCKQNFNFMSDLKQHIKQHNIRTIIESTITGTVTENKKNAKSESSLDIHTKSSTAIEMKSLKLNDTSDKSLLSEKRNLETDKVKNVVYATDQQMLSLLVENM